MLSLVSHGFAGGPEAKQLAEKLRAEAGFADASAPSAFQKLRAQVPAAPGASASAPRSP